MPLRTLALLALLALSSLLAVSATATAASSTRVCNEPKYPGQGYFTSLTVRNTRCATGSKLALEYYKCRIRAGGRKGRCTDKVLGYSCKEVRTKIPTEINGRVTCKRSGRTIVHTYQQNT